MAAFRCRPCTGSSSGRVVRRYERATPGEFVHLVVKKLGRIPEGGGWRTLGMRGGRTGETCAGFDARAHAFFAAHGIGIHAVMTDDAFASTRSVTFRDTLNELGVQHVWIRPRRPQIDGEVERSDHARSRAFDRFFQTYDHHLPRHSAADHP